MVMQSNTCQGNGAGDKDGGDVKVYVQTYPTAGSCKPSLYIHTFWPIPDFFVPFSISEFLGLSRFAGVFVCGRACLFFIFYLFFILLSGDFYLRQVSFLSILFFFIFVVAVACLLRLSLGVTLLDVGYAATSYGFIITEYAFYYNHLFRYIRVCL